MCMWWWMVVAAVPVAHGMSDNHNWRLAALGGLLDRLPELREEAVTLFQHVRRQAPIVLHMAQHDRIALLSVPHDTHVPGRTAAGRTTHRQSHEVSVGVAKLVQVLDQRAHDVGEVVGESARAQVRAAVLARHRTNSNARRIRAAVRHQAHVLHPLVLCASRSVCVLAHTLLLGPRLSRRHTRN
jgi:hypothetical protein